MSLFTGWAQVWPLTIGRVCKQAVVGFFVSFTPGKSISGGICGIYFSQNAKMQLRSALNAPSHERSAIQKRKMPICHTYERLFNSIKRLLLVHASAANIKS